MNEVNINKYLSQFNPILIVPVLSTFVAILVFLFGFKRPNEPRFQPNSSIDSIKKSKKSKKTTDIAVAIANKKGSVNSNNNSSNSNNNVNKKKTDEKKSDNGSPTKKVLNKKNIKESTNFVTKKSKTNKNNSSNSTEYGEKPADFDDGGWFTVQSKSAKQKNKVDDSTNANQTENSPPKVQNTKNNKSSKIDTKQSIAAQVTSNASEILLPDQQSKSEQQTNFDQSFNVAKAQVVEPVTAIEDQPADHVTNNVMVQAEIEKKCTANVQLDVADINVVANSGIAFDELEEWTDAKPDRKRANKKKTRKDI
ncbi:putative uncharacterized protein DDB_G0277255 [Contarinia nasturtii]|uniref:putative uncharacterized protein DDB_G0277255 n=1 Tax=Contarinia nasturtii TaxID=265458 RepID=UPI0012D44485|nr:putative uncharacterized protein DDB_G0277255 [Contarinia nasturtii]